MRRIKSHIPARGVAAYQGLRDLNRAVKTAEIPRRSREIQCQNGLKRA
jgi:hypothetical protein